MGIEIKGQESQESKKEISKKEIEFKNIKNIKKNLKKGIKKNVKKSIIINGINQLILGIDPGRDKVGFAFMNYEDKALILSGVFLFSEFFNFLSILNNIFDKNLINLNYFNYFKNYIIEDFRANFDLKNVKNFVIALGDGTNSKFFCENLKILNKNIKIIMINERGTTLQARELYWTLHRPGFLKRLLPVKMRVPDRALDDLAAWAIARRAVI